MRSTQRSSATGKGAATRRSSPRLQARYGALTEREREVFRLVIAGRLNKQIAAELGLSVVTVKVHRGQVMRKMVAKSIVDLVRVAEELGIRAQRLGLYQGVRPARPGVMARRRLEH